jgi:DNA polymerase bacteriophage-type
MLVNLDFETRSKVDLKDKGLDTYARDPSTEVICMAYSVDQGPVKLWTPGTALPMFMFQNTGVFFQAWNAAFEYNIMKHVLQLDTRWEQMIDSMAIAAANNIPQALDDAAQFIDGEHLKDPIGKRLIQKLSKPKKDGTFNEDPELLDQMYEYCKQDVRTEMEVVKNLRALSAVEQQVWVLTQKINEVGVPVDPQELKNAIFACETNKESIYREITELTGGYTANQPAKLIEWMGKRGVVVEDLTAETVTKLLQRSNLTDEVRRVLELRQQGSMTSVAKFEKMLEVQVAGRIRNTLVYHGASTGRFASRGGLNLQNIARPSLSDDEIEEAYERILVRGEGGTMEELSSLVRSAIKAPDGQVFVDVDFSSIENRVASWIAGQNDKVELFRQGLDEYKTFASTALYGVPYEEVTKEMRQISKSAVLGCMFGQGAKGLVEYADGMGVKMTMGESEKAVKAYRNAYAKVKSAWYDFEGAAIAAIQNEGHPYKIGKVAFKCVKNALWMQLPSGRLICWQRPKVEKQLTPWGQLKDGILVWSQNTFTRKWGYNKLIGSSIFQSSVQATARDMLTESMLALDNEGYTVVNCIHDEILILVPEQDGDAALERVVELMTKPPEWAPGFPLAAEGWVGQRYRK